MKKVLLAAVLLTGSIGCTLLTSCDVVPSTNKTSIANDNSYYLKQLEQRQRDEEQRQREEERRREEEQRRREEEQRRRRLHNNSNIYMSTAANAMAQAVMTDINGRYGKEPDHQLMSYVNVNERHFTIEAKIKLIWKGHNGNAFSMIAPCEVEGHLIIYVDKYDVESPEVHFTPTNYNRKVENILKKLEKDGMPGLKKMYKLKL